MSLLRRMLSPSYRQAIAAEAAGDYLTAARGFALSGDRHKVAEMQLFLAQRLGATGSAEAIDGRLAALRTAAHFCDDASPPGRALLGRVGRAYLSLLRDGHFLGRDQHLYQEAAQLLLRGGDGAGAGEAFELGGDVLAAAEAYKDDGDVERVEAVLGREERRRERLSAERDHYSEYELQLKLGQRDEAQDALRACLDAAQDKDEPQRLLGELATKLLRGGRVLLRRSEGTGTTDTTHTICYVGRFPLLLGRGQECAIALRSAGVSRGHACIAAGPALPGASPSFTLRDLGSKNGTTLGGLAIAGELPLRGEGEIGIGEHCGLRFRVQRALLELEVVRGLDRGQRLVASTAPISLSPGLALHFSDGRPMLQAKEGILLNGRRAPAAVQLIRGDLIDVAGVHLEVLE